LRVLGLITARRGSKGIPGKNIKVLGHQPLIAYVIQDGLQAKLIDKLIVSTDAEEIAEVAVQFGAEIPFIRPAELALDTTPSIDVVIHGIQFLEEKGEFFDAVCLLQPTSPFKPKGFIDACIEKFIETQADSLVSVLEVPHEYNPHWTFEMDAIGHLSIATGEAMLIPRRQELPKAYHRDGSVYISKVSLIKERKVLVGGNTVGMISDAKYYANLDTLEDWEKAEKTHKQLYPCAE
jgi:CMP-N,N'-diacetyllegionaminic acid synthase